MRIKDGNELLLSGNIHHHVRIHKDMIVNFKRNSNCNNTMRSVITFCPGHQAQLIMRYLTAEYLPVRKKVLQSAQ